MQLSAQSVMQLFTQRLVVSLWHHIPRSEAICAALEGSRKKKGTPRDDAPLRTILLGSVEVPLAPLIIHPLGVHGWHVLHTARGGRAGAVCMTVRCAALDGVPRIPGSRYAGHPYNFACVYVHFARVWVRVLQRQLSNHCQTTLLLGMHRSLLHDLPPWPSLAPTRLQLLPAPALAGQPARCTVYVDEAVLPEGWAGGRVGVRYTLPGCPRVFEISSMVR